uniref:Type I site-specific deoxyribonuclease n=1 Tax=Parastrongyloides trichosuri TaxID=131310 RepID=A0A0N4ZMX6_PARTI
MVVLTDFNYETTPVNEWIEEFIKYVNDNNLSDEDGKRILIDKISIDEYRKIQNIMDPKMIKDKDVTLIDVLEIFKDLYQHYRNVKEYGAIEKELDYDYEVDLM